VEEPILYRGQWPKNVSKTAKYSVRLVDGIWKVTVSYDLGEGLMFLAVESGDPEIAKRVNKIKQATANQEGGAFYINEYQHLIVPVKRVLVRTTILVAKLTRISFLNLRVRILRQSLSIWTAPPCPLAILG
jgi:hypothetical protein